MPRPLLPWLCLGPLLAARAAPLVADHASLVQLRSDVSQQEPSGPSVTHLLSFRSCSQDPNKTCNAHFFQQLRNLSDAAQEVPGIRQHLYQGLPRELYTDPRWAEHVQEGVRGRGYWFWKPALVNLLLREGKFRMGDIVVWSDADACQAFRGKRAANLWSAFMDNYDQDILVQPQPYCEATWTKGDVFEHFGVEWDDPHYGLTMQPKAQFWVIRLNKRTVKFMRYWEDLVANFSLVSDLPSGSPNAPLFRQNRHDQSLYSMLLKASGLETGKSTLCALYENITTNLNTQTQALRDVPPRDPGMLKGMAPENAGALQPANASAPEEPVLHPKYGIKGLKIVLDSFKREAMRLMDSPSASLKRGETVEKRPRDKDAAKVRFAEEERSGPLREICVRGACYDLDTLPPGALPSGVA